MHPVVRRAIVLASVTAGGVLVRRIQVRAARTGAGPRTGNGNGTANRWRVVTVNRAPEQVAPGGRLPEPVAKLGQAVEVQVRPAPGDRGTELAVRRRDGEPSGVGGVLARVTGNDPRQQVRAALRQAKQLVETGEVQSPDTPPTTRRTLRGLPLELATRRAGREGRL
jgi:hypothetical protein